MKNLIPLVQAETVYSFIESVNLDTTDDKFIKKELKKLVKKNPVIVDTIKFLSKNTNDVNGCMICALVVYKLLERQAEAEYMDEFFS